MAGLSTTFQPPMRTGMDIVLITDIGLLFLHAVSNIPIILVLILAFFINAVELLVWIFWVRNQFSVEISDGTVYGPAPDLQRIAIPRPRIDVWRTENLRSMTKPKGYLDLWSQDGKRIRLFRKIIGRGNVFIISQMLLGDAFESNKKKYRYL